MVFKFFKLLTFIKISFINKFIPNLSINYFILLIKKVIIRILTLLATINSIRKRNRLNAIIFLIIILMLDNKHRFLILDVIF